MSVPGKFTGIAVLEKKGELQNLEFDPPKMQATDVDVAVDYCGVCHSDLHSIHGGENHVRICCLSGAQCFCVTDFANVKFPVIAGHEVIGHVVRAGDLLLVCSFVAFISIVRFSLWL